MSHSSEVLAGRYRLLGRIAAGAMGEVWRAADLVLDRPVAIKLLRSEYAGHSDTLARFRAEARHAGALSHPRIAQVYDYGEADPSWPPYLVMELVNGPSLAQVLTSGPLRPGAAMDVVAQAAEGLDAAHRAGLVHRDIKPGNLLVGPDGQVKITDFGIAHALGSAPITRTGMLVGTPAYLAPERAAGGPGTPASDLYSLGVVAYQCLAGTVPFSGTPVEMALAHRQQALPPLPAAVPPGAAALVAALTAKDPAGRPPDAADVARRARRLCDIAARASTPYPGHAPNPPPATLADMPDQPSMDDPETAPTALPPTVAGGVTPTLAGIPTVVADARFQDEPPPAGQPPRGRTWSRRGVALTAAAIVAAGLTGWLASGLSQANAPQGRVAASRPASHASSVPATHTVEVNGGRLLGHPVGEVRRLLRQAGLRPQVVWVTNGHQAPGTVLSVRPSGPVPTGALVTVDAARLPPGHGHGHGNGNGQGGNGGD